MKSWKHSIRRFEIGILSCKISHHRANLTRTFKTEYQPPTGGTTEQEILKQVPCSFFARTPGERRTRLAIWINGARNVPAGLPRGS